MKLTVRALFFIACSVFGIWAIIKFLSPLLSLRTWLEAVLFIIVLFLAYLVDAVRRLFERRISKWAQSTRNIEILTLALGACDLAFYQLEKEEVLSKDTFQSVKDCIGYALDRYTHDPKQADAFYHDARRIPISVNEQKTWVDSQRANLRAFISEERQAELKLASSTNVFVHGQNQRADVDRLS